MEQKLWNQNTILINLHYLSVMVDRYNFRVV